ncbi:MAG: hypothetical protein ACE5DX_05580 [Candidatus Dojkabacteria bacterium]
MDGKELLYRLRQLLSEDETSGFMDNKTSYSFLYEAALEFVVRTDSLKSTQSITTVADQKNYTLNADFMRLYLKNDENELFIKYNDGTNTAFILLRDYEDIILSNQTTSVSIPDRFTIIDDPTLDSRISGTATSAGAISAGESTLTDTSADFSDVSVGDVVHNTTDGSDGFVLSKTSSTVLVVALFGGTANDWTSSDAYVIQPQGRLQIILDPPPSTAGHTITVEYVQKPNIVASDYGVYRFPPQYADAVVKYAAFLYKYRDREVNFGDAYFQIFNRAVHNHAKSLNKSLGRGGYSVNFKKRSS